MVIFTSWLHCKANKKGGALSDQHQLQSAHSLPTQTRFNALQLHGDCRACSVVVDVVVLATSTNRLGHLHLALNVVF